VTDPSADLDCLFKPGSVAVIGASRAKGSVGREILHRLVEFEFNGKVFPVNPRADVIHSMKCYRNVLEIPDRIDLAIVVVPKDEVLPVLEDCGRKGVKGVVVITAGFRETGPAGRRREERALETVRRHGMRMVGPNCMGIINTHPQVRLDATFAPTPPLRGKVAFLSQSGAMGVAIMNLAHTLGLGFSFFVSIGNRADVSGNDLLSYWAEDEDTEVILMYLESFGNPRHFTRIARSLSRNKPIVAVKSGRTAAGARAATSHTGALAGADVAVDALLDQCGVIRVDGVDEMFDLASCFVSQPEVKSNRVAIVSNAGGPGILATDACIGNGLVLADLSARTRKLLRAALVPEASVTNPVDMLAEAGPRHYEAALNAVLSDRNVDSVIVIDVPPVVHDTKAVVNAAARAAKGARKPVLGCFMAREDIHENIQRQAAGRIPIYRFPESAARALARFTRYYEKRRSPVGRVRKFRVDQDRAAAVFERAREEGRLDLGLAEASEVLEAYGIRVATWRLATTVKKAREAAKAIGYPVALKLDAEGMTHKTEVGGVLLNLRGEREVEQGFRKLKKAGGKGFRGVVVQEQVTGARETILGMSQDPSFGPLLMFGLGGIHVEVLRDVAFRVHPITDREADLMIDSIKASPLLEGVRGEPPVDRKALRRALLGVSQLVSDFDDILEMDVNPYMAATEKGESRAVDVRIRLGRSNGPHRRER
jgi:acetyl coenzyme A synthetase (ADP forming)-like protein